MKQICKDRKIVGYSKERKAELVQLLLRHDEEEAKMGAKTGDTVEELRQENARLRKENLFLQLLSSDVFEEVMLNLHSKEKKKLSIREIQVGDKVQLEHDSSIWVGRVIKKYLKWVRVRVRKDDRILTFKCLPRILERTDKDIEDF